MILKPFDIGRDLETLQELRRQYPSKAALISDEVWKVKAGLKAEQEAARHIERRLGRSRNCIIINNLRLALGTEIVQIDHMIVNRAFRFTLLETKSAKGGLRVDAYGNFFRKVGGKYQGMPSPIAQVNTQAALLKEYFEKTKLLPSRLGRRPVPAIEGYVLIAPEAELLVEPGANVRTVHRFDSFIDKISEEDDIGFLAISQLLLNLVAYNTLEAFGNRLCSHHRPQDFDWRARFGLPAELQRQDIAAAQEAAICVSCASISMTMKYGFGYYLTCDSCGRNQKPKLANGETIRKQGGNFFLVGPSGEERLYHVNRLSPKLKGSKLG